MYFHITILALGLMSCSASFTDEMQTFELEECIGEDKFPCHSGKCVLQSQYCDGRVDCDDGTDENFCLGHQADMDLCNETHQFFCRDHSHCIPYDWICNNETDCLDGSDEVNCTGFNIDANATCKGFRCSGDGTCISNLWVCDGRYDCDDMSDEYSEDMCRHSLPNHFILDGSDCHELPPMKERHYKCLDSSYCLPAGMMCDGMKDCRDGTDEGDFCKNWHTMCSDMNYTCTANNSKCSPDRTGPTCICDYLRQYNYETHHCDDVDECQVERPECSHMCINLDGRFSCKCDEGYAIDEFGYLCYAKGPEAMLFFSTRNEIKFVKVKSRQVVTVASGVKEAHGVSYDGSYVYWVDVAQGHQSIVRAHLEDIEGTKQVLVGLGLEDPGGISIDWLGHNIYFSDAVRGTISVCSQDAAHCATIPTDAKHPKFVTVDPRNGKMYWADFHNRAVIMSARMDGSGHEVLVDHLETFGTGLALDVPNERLYFVDRTLKVVTTNGKHVYSLLDEPFHRPYAIAVFENTVFWSDLTSQTIQTMDKMHGSQQKRNLLVAMETPVFGMHIYHPALMPTKQNPCQHHNCSHLCYVTSNITHVCGCPDGMQLKDNVCHHEEGYRPQYLVVSGGEFFTRLDYNTLGNPESHATHFDVGRVQAMAYDTVRDTLYLYDGQRRSISYVHMSDFTLGVTPVLIYQGLDNVVDMDYDYASDTLYILDAGRRLMEVVSLRTQQRAIVYKFMEMEIPISFCVLPDHGIMLVAVVENEEHNNILIDSISLDGMRRSHVIMNNLKGPHVRLKYVQFMDIVFISDEGNGIIDSIHPEGSGRENFRELSTTVTSLALTDAYVFWTDRRTSRLFWSGIHESTHRIQRIDFSIFPNNTQLLIQATTAPPDPTNPLLNHPCLKSNPCTDVCVQSSPIAQVQMGYKCLCPTGYYIEDNKCVKIAICEDSEFYCHRSNMCIQQWQVCNRKNDCTFKEDESGCEALLTPIGKSLGVFFSWAKLHIWPKHRFPSATEYSSSNDSSECDFTEFQCNVSKLCIPRSLMCDKRTDCPDGSDELHEECDLEHCFDTEFQCVMGSCVPKTWKCDGDNDCEDGTDEVDCENTACKAGSYQCRNRECIEVKKRCDGQQDCFDFSDEEECDEQVIVPVEEAELPHCADYEIACELDKTICLPPTAQCNLKIDCPGGTDENNCEVRCSAHGWFSCKQQFKCIPMRKVCNGKNDCVDGSDETPDACLIVNKTSILYPPVLYPKAECHNGYMCDNGQCIESHEVCDHAIQCFDGSDEEGQCGTACINNACSYACAPTPRGPLCYCSSGYKLSANSRTCEDIDECANEVCSQSCINNAGSFLCTCHHGYALRADRRSCKATRGNMSILYVSGNTVRSISADGSWTMEYSDPQIATVTDLAYNVRKNKLYVTSLESNKLIEMNSTHNSIEVTNVGRPSRVTVEWITGNVYFIDNTPGASCVRVCDVSKKRCAKLQKLPSDAQVPALVVDPKSRLMFYCVTSGLESVVWAATLSGHKARDLATVRNCTGLAVDSFTRHLYVAESGPPHIIRMDYTGDDHKKLLADHPQLQSPHGLAIFEDYIYFLVANSFRLNRCRLYGSKHCETFIYRVFDANTFVIDHESVQRDDVRDDCDGAPCANVCVLDVEGPKCVCDDGSFAKDGICPLNTKVQLPLFNGWSYQDHQRVHRTSFVLVGLILVLLTMYLGIFVYYHFVYKSRRAHRGQVYAEVRYQTNAGTSQSAPTVDMATDETNANEFVNPLQYVRNIWRQSFRGQTRPVGTAGLSIDVSQSPQQNVSDTESDLDDREKMVY